MRILLEIKSVLVLVLLALTSYFSGSVSAAETVDFNREVRPILSNYCFTCHGPDEAERQADLRLDTKRGAFEDLGGYAAIVPGKPDESELVYRLTAEDPDERMPPESSGKSLTKSEIELLHRWVEQGADYAEHWSYVKPARPELPAVKQHAWPRNEIDHFILARLEKEGLSPSEEADRYALIRRLSLDLTGLPPTLEEVDRFINDESPKAYEQLVDRLLEKNAYGEHWARMWLDLARYADSAGYADDPPRTIWAFRDYVIRSLNANKPFDQFTIEQVAGDLLPDPTDEQLIATAFHRNTLTNNEGGTNDEEFRNVAIVDRVNTTFAVWMGTTMACAQCHSHKYDPITQEEYFRFFAIFNNSQDADRRDESPLLQVWTEEQEEQKAAWQKEITELESVLRTITPQLREAQANWEKQFSGELKWQTLLPTTLKSKAGATLASSEDGIVTAKSAKKQDVYTLEFPASAKETTALRLETLPDDSLPNGKPGQAAGNFVVSRITASVVPTSGGSLPARFVRIEIPGKQKILSVAEVQVFSGAENVARQGKATQSSTDYEGPAKLAIDGNTDGHYFNAKSTTHTAQSDNPWWEVDLQAVKPIDRILIWNRTDGTVGSRLSNFRLAALDEERNPLWEQTVKQPPKPKVEFPLSGVRAVTFQAAYADHTQSGFDPAHVIAADRKGKKGWAIGGQVDKPHSLTLIPKTPIEIAEGSKLKFVIEQQSDSGKHTLGRFRIAATSDARAAQFAKVPANILAILRTAPDKRTAAQNAELQKHYLSIAPQLEPQRQQLAKLKKQLAGAKPKTTVPIMRERPENQRRTTKIQKRGNFLDTGKEVTPGLPAAFPTPAQDEPMNRLTVAKWLVDQENPLTPRVIANRYWEAIFGNGIVVTSEEFGSQGKLPTHPELLDWLATELVRNDWDVKAFLKLLVTSAAYRQSSRVTPEMYERDPDNLLLARGPRFRLSAEMVRDQALAVSGLLSSKMYGPPVKPPQPSIGLKAAFGSGIDWKTSQGEDRYRRGLYTTWRRSNPYPSMAAFDAPNREVCTVRRDRTNTPLQALVTLNDPVYVEAAQALGRRMLELEGTVEEKATHGFRLCLARPPRQAELARLTNLFEAAQKRLSANPEKATQLATNPIGPVPQGVDADETAAWSVVGNVLLNLDEMFMKR